MRIAHVVTVCAALIPAFHRAETVQPDRRPEKKHHHHHHHQAAQPRRDNVTDVAEITFTTLQPETLKPSIRFGGHGGAPKQVFDVRPGRSMAWVRRSRSNGDRRRRQLRKSAGNLIRVGRSYETTGENLVDHQVESVQGPPDAFDDGAVHLEPIYRVTKNKNFIDTLLNVLRRLVHPPKSVGPLVGPFHFPGIGEKVYIRLLESVQPDNLVIRFVSSLPVNEIETTFDKSILPPEELLKHSAVLAIGNEGGGGGQHHRQQQPRRPIDSSSHADVSIVGHEPLPLSTDSLRNSYGQHVNPDYGLPDALLAVGHDAGSKSSATASQASKVAHISRTYKINLKNGEPVAIQRVVRHRNKLQPGSDEQGESPPPPPPPPPPTPTPPTQPAIPRRTNNSYRGPIAAGGSYQFLWGNQTRTDEPTNAENGNSQKSYSPEPVSVSGSISQRVKWDPIVPRQSSIWEQLRSNNFSGSEQNDGPRYSIQFFSKKMRYLNLDGSVDSPPGPSNKEEPFERFEPFNPKMSRSVAYWEALKNGNARSKRGHGRTGTTRNDPKGFQDRSDDGKVALNSGETPDREDGNERAESEAVTDRKRSEEKVVEIDNDNSNGPRLEKISPEFSGSPSDHR
ncbi:uncharacterized protein LOC144473157 [Augochlora pura]